MPLFVADHHHTRATCPLAADTQDELLEHITAANASRHGVTILAEAVPTGQHRLLLIMHAANQGQVKHFLRFLTQCGTLQITPAVTSETASARGGCLAHERAVVRNRLVACDEHGTPMRREIGPRSN